MSDRRWWEVFSSLWNQIACVQFSRSHGLRCCCGVCMRAELLGAYDYLDVHEGE